MQLSHLRKCLRSKYFWPILEYDVKLGHIDLNVYLREMTAMTNYDSKSLATVISWRVFDFRSSLPSS